MLSTRTTTMFTTTTRYYRTLGDNLAIKSIADQADIDRLATFNAHIHGPEVFEMTRALILNHPPARPDYWLYIEDESTGEIISSLALIPWQLNYDGATLTSG